MGCCYHPEMEEEGMQALCRECPDDVKKSGIPSEAIHAQAIPHLPMLHQFADRLIGHLAQ
jgi:GMP synthase (glutamine-hydrolysing)